jgi:CheY-like chemotaxis protein
MTAGTEVIVSCILVVEDNQDIREIVRLVLLEEGYEVQSAPHGRAALDLIAEHRPALILLDSAMPVLSGREFLRVYRQTPGPHAPVVAFATCSLPEGADEILLKAFEIDELLAAVERPVRRE